MSLQNPSGVRTSVPRVLCPRCGAHMRLAEIIPDVDNSAAIKFDCSCGFEYQMSGLASEL